MPDNDVYQDLMVHPWEECCTVDFEPDGWCCTRPAGHDGPHMAGNGTEVVYEWSDNAGSKQEERLFE